MKFARWFGVLLTIVFGVPAAFACLWDSDTLRVEAKGKPGIVDIIVGRFERNPPLYYEMRLERVSKALAENPDDLAAYDDAAVACDRLGRPDEGVAWMERKHARLIVMTPNDGDYKDHLYRYHANIGTILAHRWLKNGANREDMADLTAGRDHIAEAIKINPDAHFGREKYQLMVMDWLIEPIVPADTLDLPTFFSPAFERDGARYHGMVSPNVLERGGFTDAVEGVSGLVFLGSAWESIDVFNGLAVALGSAEDASLARLARLRAEELLDAGKRPLKFHGDMDPAELRLARSRSQPYGDEKIDAYFTKARAAADRWHQARTDFMLAKFQRGLHPDTDASFWDGFQAPADAAAPSVPWIITDSDKTLLGAGVMSALALFVGGGTIYALRARKRRKLMAVA